MEYGYQKAKKCIFVKHFLGNVALVPYRKDVISLVGDEAS